MGSRKGIGLAVVVTVLALLILLIWFGTRSTQDPGRQLKGGDWQNFLNWVSSPQGQVFGAVLAGRSTRTLPAAVYNVLTFEQLAWGPLAAAAIVVTLPVLLLTIVIQKEIVVGLTHGGVKGG